MRASRLLQLLLLLQSRGAMSAPQLAEELEVSVRTVYRDLEALSAAGVPVYSEPGRNGGARLVDGWRTRLTGLTSAEADALPLLGIPGAAAELGLGAVLAATETKVLAALPPELRSRAARMRARFHLDAQGWFRRHEEVPALPVLSEAAWGDRKARIRYRRSDRAVERVVDPLGLVLKAGTWYLLALHRGDRRTYRVSRVESAELLDERFDRPMDFDLAAAWEESQAAFEEATYRILVRARLRADRVDHLRHVLDPATFGRARVGPVVDGWAEVEIPGESVDVSFGQLLGLGAGVEVLAPDELRARFADEFAAAAERYGVGLAAGVASPAMASTSRAASAR